MIRRLKIVALGLGLLIVLLLSSLAWVIYTESGLRFLVSHLPERLGSVTLRIENVHGTIAGGFGAERADVVHERSRVLVRNATARVNFWPLLVGRISVRETRADLVEIEVRRRVRPPPDTPPKFLPRLLSISAEQVATDRLVIISPSGRRDEFTEVEGAGIVGHRTIRIFDGSVIFGLLRGRAIGELRAGDPMRLTGEATTWLIMEGQPEWRADTSFDGDLDKLPIVGKLQVPFRADLSGEMLDMTSGFNWTADADVHNFDLRAFGGGDALGIISGKLRLGGAMNSFHAHGPLTVPGLGAGPFNSHFEGNFDDGVVNATHYEITHVATGSRIEGRGVIDPQEAGPRLKLAGEWRELRWPLAARFTAETPQIFGSPTGRYTLEGIWPYAINASGELLVPQIDPMTVAMKGALHKDHLQIGELDLRAFGGSAQLAGEARWTPAQSWALAGIVKGFNPAAFRPGFDGALDFSLDARGAPFGADGTLDLAFSDLTGKLRGTTTNGRGRVKLSGDDWAFEGVNLRAGKTHLTIDGQLSGARALRLDFSLDADDLGLLAEGAKGELHARGRIDGTADAPVIKLDAQGSGIAHGKLSIDKLSAKVDVDWRGQRTSHADVTISRMVFDERELTQFNAMLDGSTGEHTIKVDALADATSLHLAGKGAFAAGVWNATISDLRIDDDANVNLTLEAPAAVMLSAEAFRLDALCLQGKLARLCGEAGWNEAGWTARGNATNLPISTVTAGLTRNVEYQGTVSATARASASGGLPFVGEARVELADAAIRHKLASGRTDVITFGSGSVALNAEPGQLSAELRLDAGERGLISGRLRAERSRGDIMASPLRGQLQMATGELGFLTLYLPAIDRAAGRFDANLSFDGTLGAPRASGVIKLSDAEIDLYQLNLALRALDMEARILSNNLEFRSTAKAGAGTLESSGRLEWRDNLPYGEIRLNGENLRLVDVPEARIDASPDLNFLIAGREMLVKGEVKIPLARIEPADLTNAVLSSADERLVGTTDEVTRDPFRVTTEITMTLGDKVTIETHGLSGHITGSITERSLPDAPSRATGELQVRDGQYVALARRLDIERGRLIFSGGLLADPAIDIRAVKIYPDVKAGVNVRGSLREPRLSFFSEPSIPQSQIVSLLLAGGSLESVQDSRRAGTPGAQQEVAGQAAALLAAQLGSKLGIPDISVESTLSNETSLVLGKYLSPRLYVSYGISLTESINTIKMRYTLDDRWTIRTEAGKERSADLVYTIEK